MANNEVKLVISADGSGAIAALGKVGSGMQRLESDTGSLVSRIKSHWLGFTAAIAGSALLLNKAWSLAEMAAGYEEQMAMLNRFAATYNTTATSIVADIKEITNGQIAMVDIAKISTKAMALNVPVEKYKELAKYADAVGDSLGMSTTQALETLTEAAEKGTSKVMKQVVGVVDLEAKYGKLTNTMTEQQKVTAMTDLLIDKLSDKYGSLGKGVESTADKMERLTASVKDLQLMTGTLTIRLTAGLAAAFNVVAAAALVLSASFWKTVEAGTRLLGVFTLGKGKKMMDEFADYAKESANTAYEMAGKQIGNTVDNFQTMIAPSADLAKAMASGKPDKDDKNKKWADKMKLATMDWNKKIELLNPALDETDKQLKELTADAAKLTEEYGKQKWITEGLAKGKVFIDMQEAEREFDVYAKLREEQRQTDKKYADETAKEIDDLNIKKLNAYSESYANEQKLRDANTIALEGINKGELAGKIKQYDIETAEVWRHADEVIASHELTAEQILQIYDEASAKQLLLDIKYRDALLASNATLTDGLAEGFKKYTQELKTTFQQGVEIARQTAQAMESAFSDLFFDAFQGKMKSLADYLKSFLTSVQRALANALGQQVTGSIISGISNLFTPSTLPHELALAKHSGGMVMHEGGFVPRFHFGGLSSDEVPAILQRGEYVVSRRGVSALDAINQGKVSQSGGDVNVNIIMENKTGLPLGLKQRGARVDEKTKTKAILVDLMWTDPEVKAMFGARA